MRCPQCARTVEEGAPFCACGYPIFWDERAERPSSSSRDEDEGEEEQDDLSRIPGEDTVPPPPRRTAGPPEPADQAPPTEQLAPMVACPDCDTPNPISRTLCQRCGARLQPPEPEPAPPQPRRSAIPTGVLVLGVVVLMLAAAGVWYLGSSRDAGAGEEPTDAATPDETTIVEPSATPTPTPTEAEVVIHVVAPGDTLTTIAQLYGTTVEALVEANGIANPDVITLGQQLVIPSSQ